MSNPNKPSNWRVLTNGILKENPTLVLILGTCPTLAVTTMAVNGIGMSVAVIFVMALATAVTWPIYTYILVPKGLSYLQTIVFILIIAALVQFVEIALKKYIPALHKALGIYLPLITTNCAVLGVTILNLDEGYTFGQSLVNAVGSGLGFLLAMVLFSGVRSRVDAAAGSTPKAFQGIPITLVAAAICSVSFMGFSGIVDGLFK